MRYPAVGGLTGPVVFHWNSTSLPVTSRTAFQQLIMQGTRGPVVAAVWRNKRSD
jgi:hypothetical protein